MEDYSKECWYCHFTDMEDKGTYVQCRHCGATWNPLPDESQPALIEKTSRLLNLETDRVIRQRYPRQLRRPRAAAKKV